MDLDGICCEVYDVAGHLKKNFYLADCKAKFVEK